MTCFAEKGLKLERFGRSRSGPHTHSLALTVSHSLVATETLVPACHPLARHPMKRIVHDDGEIITIHQRREPSDGDYSSITMPFALQSEHRKSLCWDQVCSIDFQTFATK